MSFSRLETKHGEAVPSACDLNLFVNVAFHGRNETTIDAATELKGASRISKVTFFHSFAFFWKLAPGNQAGTYLTIRSQSFNLKTQDRQKPNLTDGWGEYQLGMLLG